MSTQIAAIIDEMKTVINAGFPAAMGLVYAMPDIPPFIADVVPGTTGKKVGIMYAGATVMPLSGGEFVDHRFTVLNCQHGPYRPGASVESFAPELLADMQTIRDLFCANETWVMAGVQFSESKEVLQVAGIQLPGSAGITYICYTGFNLLVRVLAT